MTPREKLDIAEERIAAEARLMLARAGGQLALISEDEAQERRSIRREYDDFVSGKTAHFSATFCISTALEIERHQEFLGYSKLTEELSPTTQEGGSGHVKSTLITNADHGVLFTRRQCLDANGKVNTVIYTAMSRSDEQPTGFYLG